MRRIPEVPDLLDGSRAGDEKSRRRLLPYSRRDSDQSVKCQGRRDERNARHGEYAGMPGMKGSEMKGAEEKPGEFVVPVERQQQIGVTFATVEIKPLSHSIRAVGRVVPETQRVWRVVSRTTAYVQELGVNAPGELVKKNQVLMKLYSPELLTTQRELIDLLPFARGHGEEMHLGARRFPASDRIGGTAAQALERYRRTDHED